MRWSATRAAATCSACDAELGRGAQWCGSCGALARDDVTTVDDDPQTPPPPPRHRPRVAGVLGLVAVLLAVLVAAMVRTPPAVPLLGTPAAASGRSASGPPPTGLQQAWAVSLGDDVAPARPFWAIGLVARGGHAAVAGTVVDLDGRSVVGTVPATDAVGADGTGVLVQDELVRVDVLDGTVLGRTALPASPAPLRALVRTRDVTVLSAVHGEDGTFTTLLLRDDGEVLAQHPGQPTVRLDRAVEDPAAVAVRDGPGADAALALVGTTDGRVLAELPGGSPQVVDVVGERALVAATVSEDVGAPGTGVLWSLRLLDATDGRTLWRTRIISAVVPRLLGAAGDTGAVVATRSGSDVGVYRIDATDGAGVEAVSQLRTNVLRSGPGFGDTFAARVSGMLRAVALDGDVVVLHDSAAEQVRAVAADGSERWRRAAPAAAGIAATGGVVAVVPRRADEPLRLLRTADGTELASVTDADTDEDSAWAPAAVLGRDLALAPGSPSRRLELSVGSATWVDLTTGARRTAAEVLGDLTAVEEPVTGGWRLIGVASDAGAGRAEPVVLRDLGRDVVQLLVPGTGFRSVDLDLPDEGDVASYLSAVVGATASRVALRTDSFEGPTAGVTHVVDRSTGAAVHLTGVVGLALREDLLLGAVPDARGDWTGLVAHDPATGERRWRRDAPPGGVRTVDAIDDELLLQASPVRLEAIRLADGTTAWRHEPPVALTAHSVLGPSHTIVATVAGVVVARDRGDGSEAWRTTLGVRVTAMTGAGDDVLVGTADGSVVHLDRDGREVQRLEVGRGPVRAVAALGDTVVAVVDGTAVGLRADGSGVVPGDEVELP